MNNHSTLSPRVNPMETQSPRQLLIKLAIPSIIANLANSLYNIVDQIFIGQGLGYLGNAASNIAFPLTSMCLAIGLLTGIGAAAHFNLNIGRKDYKRAQQFLGTAFGFLLLIGCILALLLYFNASYLVRFFGASDQVYPYALPYFKTLSFGVPFLILTIGGSNLVRSDGAAKYSMMAVLFGAILNTILDPLFIFVFGWGMTGAAWATVIGQWASGLMILAYIPRFSQVAFSYSDLNLSLSTYWKIAQLGLNSLVFQLSNTIIMIVLNNVLKTTGATSVYGSDIPIAAAGITLKVNTLFLAVVLGTVQGAQPILGVNYGAQLYDRVKETFFLVIKVLFVFSMGLFTVFQVFPRPIIRIFGGGNEIYMTYCVHFLKNYLFMILVSGVQIAITNYFAAVGKAMTSAFISLNKQIIFLLPLILLMAHLGGVEAVPYSAPISDFLTFLLAAYLIYREFQRLDKLKVKTA